MDLRRNIDVTVEAASGDGWWVEVRDDEAHPEIGLLPMFADRGSAEAAAATLRLAYRMDGATVPDPTTEA